MLRPLRHLHTTPFACLAVGVAALSPSAASAAVTYDFAGSFMADTDEDGIDETYNWSFSFDAVDFLSSLSQITP